MKINIVYLLLIALLGITVSASIAQQNQNVPKTDTEVEKLKIQLQTVKNEKMEIETKLAEANAKLMNADFGKFERELRDSNYEWMWKWTGFFVGIIAVIGVALWVVVKSMIADRVEERLNGFKESVDQVKILKDQIKILEKEHAVSILDSFQSFVLTDIQRHPERIKALPEEVLLKVFDDKTRDMEIRWTAIVVLAARKSPQLVSPVLKFLNYAVDSDMDLGESYGRHYQNLFLSRLSDIHNEETYQGLKNFLNRLLTENPRHKDLRNK